MGSRYIVSGSQKMEILPEVSSPDITTSVRPEVMFGNTFESSLRAFQNICPTGVWQILRGTEKCWAIVCPCSPSKTTRNTLVAEDIGVVTHCSERTHTDENNGTPSD